MLMTTERGEESNVLRSLHDALDGMWDADEESLPSWCKDVIDIKCFAARDTWWARAMRDVSVRKKKKGSAWKRRRKKTMSAGGEECLQNSDPTDPDDVLPNFENILQELKEIPNFTTRLRSCLRRSRKSLGQR